MAVGSLPTLTELLKTDLDYICDCLSQEFGSMAGSRLLITGGAGFLGYYLILSALHWNSRQGDGSAIDVTVWDNFIRGRPTWLTERSTEPRLTIVEQDLCRPLPDTMGDFQYVIHAAGIASPTYYRRYPIETMDANINGLRNLLEYSLVQKRNGKPISGFLFFSSSEIYGDPSPEMIPTPEDYRGNVSCTGPRACYDESKRYGETLCVNFAHQHGIPVKMARPFNNYGPGLKITDRRVLPDFARDVIEGRDIVMLSDGSPMRTFCYSADSIAGYYKVLINGQPGEPYNIGVEKPEISMAELADMTVACARELFGYRGRVVRAESDEKAYLVDNPARRCPLIEKARTQIGYSPSILIEEGLRRSLIWYHYNSEAEEA